MIGRETVRRALGLIQRRSEYEYFFSKLSSAEWILPLFEEGVFSRPPSPRREGDYIQYPAWPEAEFLTRVASAAPAEAARVLLSIPLTDNARIHSDLADIALKIAPGDAALWARKESRWVMEQPFLPLLLPEKLAELIARLATNGESREAIRLAKAVFEVLPDPRNTDEARREYRIPQQPRAKFDGWEYWRALSLVIAPLVSAVGMEALELLNDLLEDALRLSAIDVPNPPHDYSYIWRDAIEATEEESRDIRDALVSAVRDAAVELALSSKCNLVITSLESRKWAVFRRIALHVARASCGEDTDIARARLLSREIFADPSLHHEYVMLLRDKFTTLSTAEQEEWLSWIEAGRDSDRMRERHRAATGEELEPSLEQEWNEQWRRDRLSPIKDSLPKTWRDRFDELVKRHGPPVFDFALHKTSVGWGSPSPISRDEIAALDPAQLRNFLAEWTPSSDPRGPTTYGLIDTLRGMDEGFFELQSAQAAEWRDLPPSYIGVLFSGAERLVKAGRQVAWGNLLTLAEDLLKIDRSDEEWRWMRKSLADLLLAGVESETAASPLSVRDSVWMVFQTLSDLALAEKNDQPVSEEVDSLTVAINSLSGRVLEGIIRYAVWIKNNTSDSLADWSLDKQLPSVASTLDQWVRPESVQLVETRAIFGLQLGPLMWLDKAWVVERRGLLFPNAPQFRRHRDAVWNTYLIYGSPFGQALGDFREEYERSVEQLKGKQDTAERRRDANHRLAEHLMTYYWQGFLPLGSQDRLLEKFFENADVELRSYAVEYVGRSFRGSNEIPPEPLSLLRELFDWRLQYVAERQPVEARKADSEELVPFGWWFASGEFDSEWSLSRLIDVLRLTGSCEPDHMVAEQLLVLVDVHPLETAQALKMMVVGMKKIYSLAGWRDEAKQILEHLVARPEEEVRREAIDIISALGERRFTEFRDLLPGSAKKNQAS